MTISTLTQKGNRLTMEIERYKRLLVPINSNIERLGTLYGNTSIQNEISDDELLRLAHKNNEFFYLENPEEDIYSLSDGTPL